MSLLTSDDVESIRWLLDCALFTASRTAHTGDIYDMNPTCWAIWLVQNQHALKAGGWTVESDAAQRVLRFESLYYWLGQQHSRGGNKNLYDPATKKLLKRYYIQAIIQEDGRPTRIRESLQVREGCAQAQQLDLQLSSTDGRARPSYLDGTRPRHHRAGPPGTCCSPAACSCGGSKKAGRMGPGGSSKEAAGRQQ